MMTLEQFKKTYEKKEIRACVESESYWEYTIDESIKRLREVKKLHKGHVVEMELQHGYYDYSDTEISRIGFYIRRPENEEEFDKRVRTDYGWYVHKEEEDLATYEKMKKRFDK